MNFSKPHRPASVQYFLLLTTTLIISLCVYFSAKAIWGQSAALFVAFSIGLSHYALAYIWSIPGYFRVVSVYKLRNLLLFFLGMLAFGLAVYWLEWLSVSFVMIFVVLISVVHNSRDFEFFFRQIYSGYKDYGRSSLASSFFASLLLVNFFGFILIQPEKFGFRMVPFLPGVFEVIFFSSLVVFILSSFLFFKKMNERYLQVFSITLLPLLFSLFLYYGFSNITLLDIFYIQIIWHYLLWYGFMMMKVYRSAPPSQIIGGVWIVRYLSYLSSNLTRFLLFVVFINLFFVVPFFVLLFTGRWESIAQAMAQSFLWGISGYVFFSVAHIYWSVLPRYKGLASKN